MDNSVVCMAYFQNYPDRKFCAKCHMTNRIFYITHEMNLPTWAEPRDIVKDTEN